VIKEKENEIKSKEIQKNMEENEEKDEENLDDFVNLIQEMKNARIQ